ncbi:MAG: class I SAM-dependent methyltransferase [Firmicutes bacterium HGW-Firmicutes-1]|jgi:ubiquinone/menaquinone biosynthesis C-methylase UbiE|nr:MAG: class I SAM-dependent methyltransferase [Firmicutes bacterium HGW-Firmicutes-1]
MILQEYLAEDIKKMDYNQLIGLVKETNRPPGGFNSIKLLALSAFLTPNSRVLEIGTSTGITSIELAKLVGCKIKAIDINPVSIEEAKKRAKAEGVDNLIEFEVQDATNTTFPDNFFDMVFCGNVTSLIEQREKAFAEYIRVLKKNGFIAAIPMYYIKKPSKELIEDVSAAIQVNIIPWDRKYWFEFFKDEKIELCWYENYQFDTIKTEDVHAFSDEILKRDHLKCLKLEAYEVLKKKYREFMMLFRDNLSHMGYSLMLIRKTQYEVDNELFTSSIITDDNQVYGY